MQPIRRMMWRSLRTLVAVVSALPCLAQVSPSQDQPLVLTVETEDNVLYRGDVFELSKLAKDPKPTTSINTAFINSVNVGDVRGVNGQPAKGISSYQVLALPFRANPQSGQAIADVDSGGFFQCIWQIVSPEGKYIGTLYDNGAPPATEHVITGGSGAFLGVTGVHGPMQSLSDANACGASTPAGACGK